MLESLVRVNGLTKTFQMGASQVHALTGVNLEVKPNSFTLVMGPSGSGKSTLLYLLGGLDRPTSGTIMISGRRVDLLDENDLAQFRQQVVGFVFQSFNLVPNMTALQNIIFPLRFGATPRKERERISHSLLDRVGLGDRIYHRPAELSGGQQQRVAIARALANDPQLILADEPTGNLDTFSSASIMHLLSELHKNGKTVLVVSHDPRMRSYATQLVFLLDGRIVSEEEYDRASLALIQPSN
jgi:putative ABC transport system ATP-binding protein